MKLARNAQTLAEIADLVEYAFNKPQSLLNDPLFLTRYDHADAYGVRQENKLTNLIMANHFESQFFQKRLKMAGVGYVASYPEYRGKGQISNIMTELLSDLYAQGVAISQLAPFSAAFYRQFGYEFTSHQKTYRISTQAFTNLTSECNGTIKRGSWHQLKPTICSLYQKLLPGQVGTVVREAWWWERLDKYYDRRFYAVAFNDANVAKGYLIYRMQGATFVIDEFAYEDDFAVRKLLTYVKAHVSSFKEIVYHGPANEILEHYFSEQQELSCTLSPYMMSRIIDIEQLFTHILLDQAKIVLEVTEDEQCPWNIGSWQLEQGTCKKVDQPGELKASIQSWSELLLGDLTLAEGLFLGKVTATKKFETEIFPKGQQRFYDYF